MSNSKDDKTLEIGKVVGIHGLRGEVKLQYWGDMLTSFSNIKTLISDNGESFVLESFRPHKNIVLLKLENIDNADDAEKLRGNIFSAKKSELPELLEGEAYIADVIGMEVYDEENNFLGNVKDYFENKAHGVFTIIKESKEFMIPAIDEFILDKNVKNNKMVVRIIEGMM
jgi:16S rRNA processing protein RimM